MLNLETHHTRNHDRNDLLMQIEAYFLTVNYKCYKYWLSHVHIHHWLCRKSPRTIRRGILCIPPPVNHPTEVICTPSMIPEPIEGQDQQLDCIYPPPGRIYPLLLAHTIILDHFDWVPMESLPNITSSHSNDSTQFPQTKHLPQRVNVTLDLA